MVRAGPRPASLRILTIASDSITWCTPPRVVKTIGQVFGLTVRSRSFGGNIAAWLNSHVRDEVWSYVKLNEDAGAKRSTAW